MIDAYIAPALIAFACSIVLLIPIALRSRVRQPADRDAAWRDRLPPALRLLRPLVRWYASAADEGLSAHKRDVIQMQLNAAGASYMITPAEFLVIRRLGFIAGLVVALYVILILGINDPMYVAVIGCFAPFSYLYPNIWLRDRAMRRQRQFEK